MNPIRHPLAIALLLCTATASLSACKKGEDVAPVPAVESVPAPAEGSAPASSAPSAPEKPAGFDINSVPVSSVALGDFPYLRMPQGCNISPRKPAHAKAPFWTGDGIHWVQGKTGTSYITTEGDADCGFSNVVANIDSVISTAGGVKVAESIVSADGYKEIKNAGVISALEEGLQGLPNNPVATWVIRLADRQIWIQVGSDHTGRAYNFLLAEEAVPAITAGLLPASEMRKQLDAAGKVALQVNFATDKTEVLPDSLPQIEQVAALLKQDPSLQLAVNGHTDDSGNAAHNQQLSEGRAKSVVALLTAKGIDAARLTAAGFGSTQPVADNGTEEGKAKNRRVELVKR